MTLVYDQRQALQGTPGLHALIAGVSLYRHLPDGGGPPAEKSYGMKQLSSTALSAYRIYRWLLERKERLPVPLATVRLLLSPSPAELAAEPELAGLAPAPCTRAGFAAAAREWRKDAATSQDGFSFFYFAGHGVQRRKDDAVLLFEDFGDPTDGPLNKAVAVDHLFNGMAPRTSAQWKVARRQVYFVDACRITPSEFRSVEWLEVPNLWDVELGGLDDRSAPVFFAAIPGTKAYAVTGEQTLFSKALLACLDGAAAETLEEGADGEVRWGVTVHSLNENLAREIAALNDTLNVEQEYVMEGRPRNMPLYHLDAPPSVEVAVEIAPAPAVELCRLQVLDDRGGGVWDLHPVEPHPYVGRLPAGYYQIAARIIDPPRPPYTDFVRLRPVRPPRFTLTAKVG